jgi:anti-anti-sigma regulatory factor
VDLSEVAFLSSSAVSFLIRQTRSIRERRQLPAIVGVSAQARRVLELLGATGLFACV